MEYEPSYVATHNQAAARWNRGEYLLASRAWEEVWHALGADEGPGGPDDPRPPPPEAILFRGLIRLAAGMARWAEGRHPPAVKLLGMGLADLEAQVGLDSPLNVHGLVRATHRFLDELERVGPERSTEAAALVPRIEVQPL